MRTKFFWVLIVLVSGIAVGLSVGNVSTVCAESNTLFGEPKPLGQGTARSVVVLNEQGKPVSIGFALTKTALSGLPTEQFPPEVMLTLPKEAAVPPFNHLVINWNPQGHEPEHIYDLPHFDFHFYLISSEERKKITAQDTAQFAKAPAAEYVPADYKPIPGGVPQMGAHWFDPMSSEFQGKPFTATFIYGSYNGAVTFLEPMITLAFLEAAKNFSAEIKQPAEFEKKGYYPNTYRILYDEQKAEYRILLDDLTSR